MGTVRTGRDNLARRGFQHHGRNHIAVVGMVGQGIVDGVFQLLSVAGQSDELLGAAVLLAAFVVHDAFAQCLVGSLLFTGIEGGVDVQAAGIGVAAVLGKDQLTGHFSHVLCMYTGRIGGSTQLERLFAGLPGLICRDEAVFLHALDDVELADAGALGVADRVVGRWSLGQAGQHGGFGHRDVLERMAEIGFTGCCKAIGTVAKENLVHVDLEDLLLGEQVLKLEGQQDFVDLAGIGLLGGEVDIACDLHGDGRGALALDLAQVGQRSTQHALVVHAAMLEEAGVFDGQHRIRHDLGDLVDGREGTTFLPKFAQQSAFAGVHPQR